MMPKVAEIPSHEPILELFELIGLNGYKNLSLEITNCIRIVVAENGTGKTTLLNALYNTLTKNFTNLYAIAFESLTIKFHGKDKLSLTKSELFPKDTKPAKSSAYMEILSYGVEESELLEAFSEHGPSLLEKLRRLPIYRKVYKEGPYDPAETIDLFKRAMPKFDAAVKYNELLEYVSSAMGNIEVLYLPTFRRIEAEFSNFKNNRARHFNFEDNNENYDQEALIWFGMSDVEDQLESIRQRIKNETFSAYSRISVQSLEELLSTTNKVPDSISSENESLRSQLRLVLARLGRTEDRTGQKLWELIDSGDINNLHYENLRSYLFQMLEISTATQQDEESIEGFVKVINNYWLTSAVESASEIEKQFVFDKMMLSINIETPYTPNNLELKNLSSGEKQIVSIFAKLHLQPKKQFMVLIDEPELSLSMMWQRLFLIDILESPSCEQLIAITHSPFIFENALDPYAQPLSVTFRAEQC
jgi:predicted ATPase